MMRVLGAALRGVCPLALGALVAACEPTSGPRTDSQTNWYRPCDSDAQCGSLSCLCGACTRVCDADATCASLEGASCVPAADAGSVAFCGGQSPDGDGLCLRRCEDDGCPSGQACVAGACSPLPQPTVRVFADPSATHQALIGLGATLAYSEADVLRHPSGDALVSALFSDLGLDLLRFRNRYGHSGDEDLASAAGLVALATDDLGRAPTVILSSWSPPAALKANGTLECRGDPDTCTLARAEDGGFDYAGFATYWRDSLDAYAAAGLTPDFIGVQNNPDFVPEAAAPGEACRFLPTEGTTTALVSGVATEVEYPGFAEALAAVVDALDGLAAPPRILAPETSGIYGVAEYVGALDPTSVDALAHHLYGTDPAAVDLDSLAALGDLGQRLDLPLLQTEMLADGFGTAVLAHHALTTEGAAAYVQGVLAALGTSATVTPGTLVALGVEDFTLEDAYHALRHFAHDTDPGWLRVDAGSDAEDLLVSAWRSPDADALTLVIVNAAAAELDATVDLGDLSPTSSTVTRTVFDGVERSAELGALPAEGTLRVPGRAIVTVALRL